MKMNLPVLCVFCLVVACQSNPLHRFKRAFEESVSRNQRARNKQITPITLKIIQNNASPITLLNSHGETLSNLSPASAALEKKPPNQKSIDQSTTQESVDTRDIAESTSQLADQEPINQPAKKSDGSGVLKHCSLDDEALQVGNENKIPLVCEAEELPSTANTSTNAANLVNSGKLTCSCKKSAKIPSNENKITGNLTTEGAESVIESNEETNPSDFTCSCRPANSTTYDLNLSLDPEHDVDSQSNVDNETNGSDFQAAFIVINSNSASKTEEKVVDGTVSSTSLNNLTCSCRGVNSGAKNTNESSKLTCSCKNSGPNSDLINSLDPTLKNISRLPFENSKCACGRSIDCSNQLMSPSNSLCSCFLSNLIDRVTNSSPPITCASPVNFGGKSSIISESMVNSKVQICNSDATNKDASNRTFCHDCNCFNCDCGACGGRGSSCHQQTPIQMESKLKDCYTQVSSFDESAITKNNCNDDQPYIFIYPIQQESRRCDPGTTLGKSKINEGCQQCTPVDSIINNCCTSEPTVVNSDFNNDNCGKQRAIKFCPLLAEGGCCGQETARAESQINNNGCSRQLSISVIPLIQQATNCDQGPKGDELVINNGHCDQEVSPNPSLKQEGSCCQKSFPSDETKLNSSACDQPTRYTETCDQQYLPPVEQEITCNHESRTNFSKDFLRDALEMSSNLSCNAGEALTQVINNTDSNLQLPILPRMCAFIMYPRMNASNFDPIGSSSQLSSNPMLYYPFNFNKVDQIVCCNR